MTADDLITRLDLQPHPEGGYFRETFRDADTMDDRARSTAIYYLLKAGERSAWHRVDAVEIWHYYAGSPLSLSQAADGEEPKTNILGPDVLNDQSPQIIIPKGIWQSAQSLGGWTLVGCTVAPGFEFSGFEMAPNDQIPKL